MSSGFHKLWLFLMYNNMSSKGGGQGSLKYIIQALQPLSLVLFHLKCTQIYRRLIYQSLQSLYTSHLFFIQLFSLLLFVFYNLPPSHICHSPRLFTFTLSTNCLFLCLALLSPQPGCSCVWP